MEYSARDFADDLIAHFPRHSIFIEAELLRFSQEPGAKDNQEWHAILQSTIASHGRQPAETSDTFRRWGPGQPAKF